MLAGPLRLPSTLMSVFVRGFSAGVAGIAAAALIYWFFQSREYAETVLAARAKLWRAPKEGGEIVAASAEDVGPSRTQ